MGRKKTLSEFINKANEIHNGKYDYGLVEYINAHTKIKIICLEHGIFKQTPDSHVSGHGCPICKKISLKLQKTMSVNSFIQKVLLIHNHKYDYSLVKYESSHKKIKIICPTHGIFEQTPNSHMNGNGCKQCSNLILWDNRDKITTELFIEKSLSLFSECNYDYSLVDYINPTTKVKIICPIHGTFEKTPNIHISKRQGCPKCKKSKGEKEIIKYFIKNNISYKDEVTFNECFYKNKLKFDFYLKEYNLCIEFDGEQHFKPIGVFGGDKKLSENQIRDHIKNEYCKENNINLLRIRYDEYDIIDEILDKKINRSE